MQKPFLPGMTMPIGKLTGGLGAAGFASGVVVLAEVVSVVSVVVVVPAGAVAPGAAGVVVALV